MGSRHDVIIIGAGSAGAAIAARASERPDLDVLLIEAGPHPLVGALPHDLADGRHNSLRDHDWAFEYAPVHGRRQTHFPRGRVVGGSSAVNTAIALRPAPEDLDGWTELGNDEWSFDRCLPALKRLERDLDYGHEDHHGDAGPISIRRHVGDELTETHQAFLATATDLGYEQCPDHNHPSATGAGPQPMNKLGAHLRVSTAIGYLAGAIARPNLEIRAETTTRRVLVRDGRAVGVEVETPDGAMEAHEARLVVVAAGAIQTPPLLVRSGIGPRDDVLAIGVDPVADVPGVGRNLDDHPATMLIAKAVDPALADPELPLIQTILRYPGESAGPARADLQIELITYIDQPRFEGCFGLAAVLETTHRAQEGVTGSPDGDPHRGWVTTTSADPHAAPVIEANFGSDPDDVSRLADALLDCVPFATTGQLGDLVDSVVHPRLPLDRDGALALAAKSVGSGYHPCGTARMGPSHDRSAVVDQRGRCHAIDGLIVADASILPFVPRANTNLTSIMIGERVGEWLRTEPSAYGL